MPDITEDEVRDALRQLDPLWDELFPAEQARIVQLLVERVDLGEDGIACRFASRALRPRAGVRRWCEESGMTAAPTVTVRAPFAIRKRGGRKVIVTPDGAAAPQPEARPPRIDNALVKALARAFRWRRMLESGDYGSIADLARAEKIGRAYVSTMLRLTLPRAGRSSRRFSMGGRGRTSRWRR
jgi:hypothetical protein